MYAGDLLLKNVPRIRELATQQAATITLGQLMRNTSSDPQSLLKQAQWLHKALPIRFARRLNDFLQLPYIVVQNRQFHAVMDTYLETLDAVASFPKLRTFKDESAFHDVMVEQLQRHAEVVPLISEGYWEVRQMYPHIRLDDFLDNLFTTRISHRILLENYVNAHNSHSGGNTGIVKRDLSPHKMLKAHSESLIKLTRSVYGCSPQVEFRGNLACTLDYIPRHLTFVVQEVLKNALRATVERHLPPHTEPWMVTLPDVIIELQKGDYYVIIKISDQGGGMPKKMQNEVWQYGWTTAEEEEDITLDPSTWPGSKTNAAKRKKELCGYGFGLPLTRLFAQYFGGEVFMQAIPGHGTDMYLLLNHLKEGAPSTEMVDPSTALAETENTSHSIENAP